MPDTEQGWLSVLERPSIRYLINFMQNGLEENTQLSQEGGVKNKGVLSLFFLLARSGCLFLGLLVAASVRALVRLLTCIISISSLVCLSIAKRNPQ